MRFDQIIATLAKVKFKDFAFEFRFTDDPNVHYVVMAHYERDHATGHRVLMYGRKWLITPDITTDDIVRTCFAAVMAWVEHEAREEFSYKGAAIFDPHFNVEEAVIRAPRYMHTED